jgi:hypothetical protein
VHQNLAIDDRTAPNLSRASFESALIVNGARHFVEGEMKQQTYI